MADGAGAIDAQAPLLSIVLPTYNRWKMTTEATRSALAQDCDDLEVLIVDDGSTDDSASHLRSLVGPRVRLIEQPNLERGAARNRGASEARGRFVMFLDADDLLEPWYVSQLADAVVAHPTARMFSAPAVFWDPDSGAQRLISGADLVGADLQRATRMGTTLVLPGVVVARAEALEQGGFPEDRAISGSEDYVWIARLVHRLEVIPLVRPSVKVREHDGRSMNDHAARVSSMLAASEFVLRNGLRPSQELGAAERADVIVGAHRFCAAQAYLMGEMSRARRHLRVARSQQARAEWLAASGRLWCQTWLGAKGSRAARSLMDRLR